MVKQLDIYLMEWCRSMVDISKQFCLCVTFQVQEDGDVFANLKLYFSSYGPSPDKQTVCI